MERRRTKTDEQKDKPIKAQQTEKAASAKKTAQPTEKTQSSAPGVNHFVAEQKAAQKKKSKTPLKAFAFTMQRAENNEAARIASKNAEKIPVRVWINAIGQMFYRVGLQSEYLFIRIWRTAHMLASLAFTGLRLLLRTVITPLTAFVRGLWNDLAEPFTRFFTGIVHIFYAMREAHRQGEKPTGAGLAYLKSGVRTYHRLISTALSYLLPVSAALIFGVTVYSVLSNPYSLSVEYKGHIIGFIENETVWENAQRQIVSRIKAAGSEETWSATPTFHLRAVNVAARTNAAKLADTVIETSPEKIQNATGLYVNDTLVGVCADGTALQQMLNQTLDEAEAATPESRAEFVQNINSVSGVYFTSSLSKLEDIKQILVQNNWLQIKTVINQTYEEVLAFETIEEEDDTLYKGTKRVKQKGVNGRKQVNADIVSIEGVEVERRILSETPIEEAVPKIMRVGTKQPTGAAGGNVGQVGSGQLSFPVPGFSYITTQFGAGGHRGTDICAPYGTAIYACDGGIVVEAGYHYSWGNYVRIDHGNGFTSLYAHCAALTVGAGQSVARGDQIALVGSTGSSSGNHCHLEITLNGGLVNPMRFVSS